MKIGVIGGTYIPKLMPSLPEKVYGAFKGVDIILHVGDATEIPALKELENNFTITMAVCGDQDSDELKRYVEPSRIVEFSKRRIGMVHGNGFMPAQPKGLMEKLKALFRKPQPNEGAYYAYILSQFKGVDAIVFGHTHQPYINTHQGVFLFNPGSAATVGANKPSVGIMNVEPHSISGRIVYL